MGRFAATVPSKRGRPVAARRTGRGAVPIRRAATGGLSARLAAAATRDDGRRVPAGPTPSSVLAAAALPPEVRLLLFERGRPDWHSPVVGSAQRFLCGGRGRPPQGFLGADLREKGEIRAVELRVGGVPNHAVTLDRRPLNPDPLEVRAVVFGILAAVATPVLSATVVVAAVDPTGTPIPRVVIPARDVLVVPPKPVGGARHHIGVILAAELVVDGERSLHSARPAEIPAPSGHPGYSCVERQEIREGS